MTSRPLCDDEKSAVLSALTDSDIAPPSICRRAVDTCRFIPFTHFFPPAHRGLRPLIAFFALRERASGIALGCKVYVRKNLFSQGGQLPMELVAHEVAHVVQWLRDGTAPFLLRYLGEYLLARLRGLGKREAYLSISYEEEARRVETFLDAAR